MKSKLWFLSTHAIVGETVVTSEKSALEVPKRSWTGFWIDCLLTFLPPPLNFK